MRNRFVGSWDDEDDEDDDDDDAERSRARGRPDWTDPSKKDGASGAIKRCSQSQPSQVLGCYIGQ